MVPRRSERTVVVSVTEPLPPVELLYSCEYTNDGPDLPRPRFQ